MRRIAYGLIALLCCVTALVATRLPAATAASPACTVSYTVSSQWATGFTVQIVITNNGPALTSWDLQYAYSGNQQLSNGWSATWSQTGQNVTASNAAWNGSLGTGASVAIGAQFSYSGTNTAPTAFTLNGTACNQGGTPTPTASATATSTSTPPPPGQPSVSFTVTGLTNGEALNTTPLTATATASAGADGTVTSVTYYQSDFCPGDGSPFTYKVGTVTTAPYTFQWSFMDSGSASLAAVVTTSTGVSVMSPVQELTSPGSYYCTPGKYYVPVVALVAPASGAVLDSNSTVPVMALVGAGPGAGSITSLSITAQSSCGSPVPTVNFGPFTAAPYTAQWTDPPAGEYEVSATADDSSYPGDSVYGSVSQVSVGSNGVAPPCPTLTPAPSPSAPPAPSQSATPAPTTAPAPSPVPTP